jgi:hypothetical protein
MLRFVIISLLVVAVAVATHLGYKERQVASASLGVVAQVNGNPVLRDHLDPGLELPVAIENAITRAVLAEAARTAYPLKTAIAVQEAQAQVWLIEQLKLAEAAVTDAMLADWYSRNIADSDFSLVKLRYYLTQDEPDSQAMYAKALAGNTTSYTSLGEHMPLANVPYGAGKLLDGAKAGDVTAPMPVREGWLSFVVSDVRPGQKPALASIRKEITHLLARQQVQEQLNQLRQAARIELKG